MNISNPSPFDNTLIEQAWRDMEDAHESSKNLCMEFAATVRGDGKIVESNRVLDAQGMKELQEAEDKAQRATDDLKALLSAFWKGDFSA